MSNLKKVTKAFVIGLIAWPSWSAWPYIPVFTGNGSSWVTNTISVEANSGGNTVSPGGGITTSGAAPGNYLGNKKNRANGEINLQRQPAQAAPIATPPAPKKSFIKRLEALITYVFKFFTT